ncbi:hypothetical protein A3F02_01890 [Candidatus Curtissbacteria bacterium RIFCSPHIGHO2_12_FULL_38_9b]|uniref:DoxX family protein n=2 Tax=Candidatus Curtissiibacteriota TaxID=1752717 RepID=A0A1F5GWI4_9BACT|nr:MAG: hypothetical protein A3A48_03910 [Candidatus Curtissbacteria bacterium RIFCSPLOWO2_01_FULL_37_9]OGD96175.1 MAG: hypothetical protein A3F02_01890 [Candidatus Curtissbacteria bacterium RIFCSPHIGHO2_12_FULL_38_9b]
MAKTDYILAILRLSLGWIFFWAFIDKLYGLGFATTSDKSWLAGGSPTFGFLKNATQGPFSSFYHSIAGTPVVDFLFMAGLGLIGVSLILGVGVKIAGYSGALMMLLMWSAVLPPQNNPVLDDHIIYLIILITLASSKSGHIWGLGKQWSSTSIVKKYKFLE